ncbi:protein BIG GRAIN 1-like E [Amborella trichopoda]|uniref:Protein BIG GRAIN 1-like E n=1 Tax=Amborella trichopoda TaxID=13333 RepID=U5D8T6_AMBTC|nr:protein BIG GRAIN 1-like E [Amborella trichopoda]ERN17842.1 hypothetical protein AMTR_s00047p00195520 [Amborella trichopoda]|eukprot:XP_006856375.1 protein BIG GRAIN 1-like E [Amborella trichopoda]
MLTNGADHGKPRRRNDSGELDVFEATRYFSEERSNLSTNFAKNGSISQKAALNREGSTCGGERRILDMPMNKQSSSPQKKIKEKRSKQPSSPGNKLASFLNSLFTQNSSKKKSMFSNQSIKDDDESPFGRRRRRSSISLLQTASSNDSTYNSSSSSDFRTPPPFTATPTSLGRELNSFYDLHSMVSLSSCTRNHTSASLVPTNGALEGKVTNSMGWSDHKSKYESEFLERESNWGYVYSSEKGIRRISEIDDGGESDSSSDLFELQSNDFGVYSKGLPVYETTHLESIQRGAPIANGSF